MKKPDSSLPKRSPEEELKHFKTAVRSVMITASKTLAHIELLSHGAGIEEISLLDHYLDYTQRPCESETVVKKGDQLHRAALPGGFYSPIGLNLS
jgi:hypothetical protein